MRQEANGGFELRTAVIWLPSEQDLSGMKTTEEVSDNLKVSGRGDMGLGAKCRDRAELGV